MTWIHLNEILTRPKVSSSGVERIGADRSGGGGRWVGNSQLLSRFVNERFLDNYCFQENFRSWASQIKYFASIGKAEKGNFDKSRKAKKGHPKNTFPFVIWQPINNTIKKSYLWKKYSSAWMETNSQSMLKCLQAMIVIFNL